MGIPYYFSYIIKNHPHIFQMFNTSIMTVDNIFIDANSIIYNCINTHPETLDYADIIQLVITEINKLLLLCKPTKKVVICFDGVAPVSKLEQQRSRRYKKRYELTKDTTITKFNTAVITPGTTFMTQLDEIISKEYQYHENILYIGSNIPGEGEHKIFNYMRDNKDDLCVDNNIIYGVDADLIMLSLNAINLIEKLYLFRETPHFIASIDNTLLPNELYVLDIKQLLLEIHNETKCNAQDYIFICFLLGNDFLPHFPSLNIRTGGVSKLLDNFKMVNYIPLIDVEKNKINWENFKIYINKIADKERAYIQNELKLRDKYERKYYTSSTFEELQTKINSIPTYERELEKDINPFKPEWEKRYYSCLFNMPINKINTVFIKKVCLNYLYGIEWTYKYYNGNCVDWRWKYDYYYPPLLCDLLQYIPNNNYEFIEIPNTNSIYEITQLCYVLPKESLDMIPNNIGTILLQSHPDWYAKDEDSVNFIWAFCKYFWESHVILPEIPIDLLEVEVNKLL
jgi:5'-3' exonuclease